MSTATKATHTPGPWTYKEVSMKAHYQIWAPKGSLDRKDDYFVASVVDYNDHNCNLANARLIAAAPEMLDALESIKERFEGPVSHRQQEAWDKLKAAIRKARGEQ